MMSSRPGVGHLGARLLACALTLGLAQACAHDSASSRNPDDPHQEGEGPLSASSNDGGAALEAPKSAVWFGSFGGMVLCSREPGVAIELNEVRPHIAAQPLEVEALLREVPREAHRSGDPQSWAPFYSAQGRPPADFATGPHLGTYAQLTRGQSVEQSCSDISDPASSRTELVMVLEVDARGGHLRGIDIDYTANGVHRTLRVNWQMAACGSEVDEQVCS